MRRETESFSALEYRSLEDSESGNIPLLFSLRAVCPEEFIFIGRVSFQIAAKQDSAAHQGFSGENPAVADPFKLGFFRKIPQENSRLSGIGSAFKDDTLDQNPVSFLIRDLPGSDAAGRIAQTEVITEQDQNLSVLIDAGLFSDFSQFCFGKLCQVRLVALVFREVTRPVWWFGTAETWLPLVLMG